MLSDIIGQSYAVTVLENALAGDRSAGSYLFVGPDGVGKAAAAREFAKHLCGAKSNDDAAARAIEANTHPDFRSLTPPKSGIISIAQIWPRGSHKEHRAEQAMLRDLHYEPVSSPRRVFVIDGAEGLGKGGADAGNSLLKTLEEPPRYCSFILTAASLAGTMPTIVSRCQVVRFGLLAADEIEHTLVDKFGVADGQARFLAAYCEGRLGRAVRLAQNPSLLAAREDLLDWMRDLVSAPTIKSFKLGESLRKLAGKLKAGEDDGANVDDKERSGREPLGRALDLAATYYRDLLAVRLLGESYPGLVNIDRRQEIAGAAAGFVSEQLEDAISAITSIGQAIERNANAQLAIDVLLTYLTSRGPASSAA